MRVTLDHPEYNCGECGLCCIHYGGSLHLYPEDADRWRQENAPSILAYFEAKTDPALACTFVTAEPHRCTIYETRPLVCRHFANGGSACRDLRTQHGLAI